MGKIKSKSEIDLICVLLTAYLLFRTFSTLLFIYKSIQYLVIVMRLHCPFYCPGISETHNSISPINTSSYSSQYFGDPLQLIR